MIIQYSGGAFKGNRIRIVAVSDGFLDFMAYLGLTISWMSIASMVSEENASYFI